MATDLPDLDTDALLGATESLMNQIYWVKHEFAVQPIREHTVTAIDFVDILERRHDFLRQLVLTVTSWVYNRKKVQAILDERMQAAGGDVGNAAAFLTDLARSKFRPGHPQGQFGELLLFNFLQAFFSAVPLLRKQRITTSVGHERFGADAIHYRRAGSEHCFFLGEAKCYSSSYQFSAAFERSLESIVQTFEGISQELDLYTYDDFIEPELAEVAARFKQNTLGSVRFELVSLIAYQETKSKNGTDEAAIKAAILRAVVERCAALAPETFQSLSQHILSRLNYIFFPVWQVEELLGVFQGMVGAE